MQNESSHRRLQQIRSLSILLDSQFRGPFGLRYGLDGLLGLVPVVGDVVTAGMSFFIIAQATTLGASPAVLTRMFLNVALENIVAIIPLVGNIFDFIWKSNNKNIALLEAHMANPQVTSARSRLFNILFFILLIILLIAIMIASFFVLRAVFEYVAELIHTPRRSGIESVGSGESSWF